jgi:GT2 family glycosyltransferase/sugar lactone lactonase YvrE
VDGKFLRSGGTRLFVKGVTYGTFAPAADGSQFPPPERVRNDFQAMAAAGINTVRVYTPPRPDLLDAAWRAGLRVMVGIPWAQHVAFLDDAQLAREARDAVVGAVRRMAEHPAVLLFAIGNEIPPAVVRWHGTRRVETFLNDLLAAARDVAPERLFSYVNFPPTEFLDLSAFDVYAFNVYLHRERDLRAYLARLQQIAGPKPLLLAEAGADSLREGEDGQARITAMHLDAAFSEGCAGAVAFAWTDEWWRGGEAVEDWRFGLVDADRRPKAALAAVSKSFAAAPFAEAARATWPRVSVVVCAYNAADTIGECLGSLGALTYPDFEILLVNDGSTDGTGDLGRRFDRVRVIDIPNGGLSAARNVGLHEATGEIVAYTDADVRVDRDWLTYLVQPCMTSDVVGSGGPNIVPDDDPWMAQCVARSPGGPTQVLLDDRIAEHVPGCNMAFRREALLAVGGFNPLYVKAGDDVDLCWRLQARGWKIGFSPAALVWHHHRATVKAYWRQQVGYGEGEAWLMHEHPDKFAGRHMMWHGRIYSALPFVRRLTRARLNTGPWGLAAFPSVYHTAADPLAYLPHGAGWQFVSLLACLLGLALWFASGLTSAGMLLCLAGLAGIGTTVQRSVACALATALPRRSGAPRRGHLGLVTRAMIAWLHIVQPWARLRGRILGHVHPPRPAEGIVRVTARPRPGLRDVLWTLRMFAGTQAEYRFWNERWHSGEDLLHRLTHNLRSARLAKRLEIDDGWRQHRDVAVALGEWAAVDLSALVEEHAQGRVLVRMRLGLGLGWPAVGAALATLMVIVLSVSPVVSSRWPVATAVALLSGVVSLLLAAWRTAGMLVGVRTSVSRTLSQMGAQAMDGGRSTWRVSPEVPQLRYAGRVALTTVLVGGIGLGGAGLVNDAREGLSSWRRSTEGDAHTAALTTARAGRRTPSVGLAVAPNGDLYLADGDADVIRRVSGTGGVATLPPGTLLRSLGPGARPAGVTKAPAWRLDRPNGVAVSRAGDLYVADAENHQVYRVDRVTGATMVVAGVGRAGSGGDGGRAVDALLDSPTAVAVDRAGNVIIADAGNNRIRRVRATDGAIDTIAGGGTAAAAGEVGDGLKGTQAVLAWPSDVAVAPSGDLYIADTGHNRVRRLEAKRGVITTVAGNGLTGASGDGGPATRASLAAPTGLALVVRRGQTTLYVADASNGRVRVVAPDGTITSLAVPPGLGVEQPARLAYDPRGWLYVADAAPDRLTVLPLAGGRARAVPLTPSGSVARTPRVM